MQFGSLQAAYFSQSMAHPQHPPPQVYSEMHDSTRMHSMQSGSLHTACVGPQQPPLLPAPSDLHSGATHTPGTFNTQSHLLDTNETLYSNPPMVKQARRVNPSSSTENVGYSRSMLLEHQQFFPASQLSSSPGSSVIQQQQQLPPMGPSTTSPVSSARLATSTGVRLAGEHITPLRSMDFTAIAPNTDHPSTSQATIPNSETIASNTSMPTA